MTWDFLKFQEIDSATWFYLSLLLSIAIFFRFRRFFSLRNWDIVTLFLLIPGLLATNKVESFLKLHPAVKPVGNETELVGVEQQVKQDASSVAVLAQSPDWQQLKQFGYLWLFAGSAYFVARSLADLIIVRRPRLELNLSTGGVVFLIVCLFSYLIVSILTRELDAGSRRGAHVALSLLEGETNLPKDIVADPATVLFMLPSAAIERGLAGTSIQSAPNTQLLAEENIIRSALIIGHLLIISALVVCGWKHYQSISTGLAMALLYLMIPVTFMHAIKLDHLIPTALLLWSIVFYRQSIVSGSLMGLASVSFFPLFLIPLWLSFYRKGGFKRYLTFFFGVTILLWLLVYFVPSLASFGELWSTSLSSKVLISQETAQKSVGFWTETTQIYRLPIAIVFGIVVVGSFFIPREKTLADLISISAIIFLLVQFWYADRGGTYLHWYMPLLLLIFFRPNLSETFAPPPAPASPPVPPITT